MAPGFASPTGPISRLHHHRHHHPPRLAAADPHPSPYPQVHTRWSSRASLPPPSPTTPAHTFSGVSWAQVEHMCRELAGAASADRFDVVLAITRGGLIPATLLCERLQLRNVLSATVMFYTDQGDQFFGMTEPRFLSFPSADALEGRRVLVVDDVWDSGRTAMAVKSRVERARSEACKVAVLLYKPEMNEFQGRAPDFYSQTTQNWVVFPWEKSAPNAPSVPTVEGGDVKATVSDQGSASLTGSG